jgi:hypothetical protein
MMRAGAKTSQYSHVSAQGQARQQIGDIFNAPVTFQSFAATPPVATASARDTRRDRLMESLVFKEMDARFVDVHPNLVGTCEWLPETPEYKRWMDPKFITAHHGFLWIKGKAGAGKSTLMKHASTHAESRCSARQHVLNFFFHTRGGSFETSTDGLFRSLLHQLLEKVPAVYNSLDKRRFGLVERQGWSSALLKDTFREAVLGLGQDQVTCYIDAMDECHHSDIDNLIQYFDNLGDAIVVERKRFFVCLSSRHYPNLRSSKSIELMLESQDGHDKDIQQYIQRRLMIDGEALKRNLVDLIESKACGVFLWVVLVVALVNQDDRNGNAAEIYHHFDQIPTELSELFNELIERGTKRVHFRPLLQWVAFSIRPLYNEELYCILMHGAGMTDLKPPNFDEKDFSKFILSASKGLVETTAGLWPRVQFIHESLRTYFSGGGVVHLIDQAMTDRVCSDINRAGGQQLVAMAARCHDLLKERCLACIVQGVPLIDPPVTTATGSTERFEQISKVCPFFEYAINSVLEHANAALDLCPAQQAFIDALPWHELNILHGIKDDWIGWQEPLDTTEPWYKACIAAKFRYPKLLKAIIEIHTPFEANSRQWGAILSASIKAADDEGVSIALRAGADPNAPSLKSFRQCLGYAVYKLDWEAKSHKSQRYRIIELLLDHGAKPYPMIERTKDCLYEVCCRNDLDLIRILLGEHLRADTQCLQYGIPLAHAVGKSSRDGNDEMFQFLLEKGAETGWWLRATPSTPTGRDAFFEVRFQDASILREILKEGPRVLPPTGATLRAILSGALEDSMGVAMYFKQWSRGSAEVAFNPELDAHASNTRLTVPPHRSPRYQAYQLSLQQN